MYFNAPVVASDQSYLPGYSKLIITFQMDPITIYNMVFSQAGTFLKTRAHILCSSGAGVGQQWAKCWPIEFGCQDYQVPSCYV